MRIYIGPYPKTSKKKRRVNIRIDNYDAWNVDSTLAMIIVPLLKKLRKSKVGAGFVDHEDVPEALRLKPTAEETAKGHVDKLFFKRWDHVLDEMIWAFGQKDKNWEAKYWTVKPLMDMKEYPEDKGKLTSIVRWKRKGVLDTVGRDAHYARIKNGYRLFGKYFENLWD